MTRHWIATLAFFFYTSLLLLGAQLAPPAPPASSLSDSEKADILVLQAQLNSLQLRQSQIASERDRQLETAIRQALETWYQTPSGSQFGALNAQIGILGRQINDKLKVLGDKHNCAGCMLDSNMKLVKPPQSTASATPKPQ